jgi:hypothetical protein
MRRCECLDICGGEQFYAIRKATQTTFFEETHPGNCTHNANICRQCYNDLETKKGDPGVECISRKFSKRNGFGPCINHVPDEPEGFLLMSPVLPSTSLFREAEIRYVLSQLTVAEESAIRMVAPLASIVRLKHGNIGTKGTVSCVWQSEKLIQRLLPSLPMECKTLVFRYENKNGKLSSFSCRRHWIERALRLLKSTGVLPWRDIVIDEKRLMAWPLDGNLLSMVHNEDVSSDEDDNSVKNHTGEDESSLGPAPGQNHETAREIFVGVVLKNELSDASSIADDANQKLNDFACDGPSGVSTDDRNKFDIECFETKLTSPGTDVLDADPIFPVSVNSASCYPSSPVMLASSKVPTLLHNQSSRDVVVDDPFCTDTCPPRNLFGTMSSGSRLGDGFNNSFCTNSENLEIPEIVLSKDHQKATMESLKVLPKGEFVNMKSTPWAWVMSFPTLFPPSIVNGKWMMLGDPTAFDGDRDQTPSLKEWAEWMMWRNDGSPAKHPTFALILNAEISQSQLRSQGNVFLHRMDISPTMTVEEFQMEYKDERKRKLYHENLQHASGNVRGTDQYWKAVRNKFKAAIFYLQYVKKKEMRYFITGSQAEFHDPFLRRLLSKYVSCVEDIKAGELVMSSQDNWFKAITDYKHIVTHFYAFKNEQWYAHFLKHTLGVMDYQGRLEFTKARGAIHGHGSAASDTIFDNAMDKVLSDLALQMYETAMLLEESAITQLEFEDKSNTLSDVAATRLTNLMERALGISASHVGKPPSDWVAPAGRCKDSGHRCSTEGMKESKDSSKTEVLHKFKFNHESELYKRRVEITNICGTHTCSTYCWKYCHVQTPYIPAVHDINPRFVRSIPNKKGPGRVAVMRCENCRMGYGYSREFPSHSCRTGGKVAVRNPVLEFDLNGQPKLSVPRNHPRILQEPVHVLHWGANADIQRFMNNATTFQSFLDVYKDKDDTYEEFCKKLEQHGMRGLEAATGCHTCNDYTTNYQCKGAESTAEWSKVLRTLEDKLLASAHDTPVRSLVGKSMHLIAKSRDCSKDEASFLLSGGELYFTSQPVRMCSLKSLEFSDIGDTVGNPKVFSFESLRKRYEKRVDFPNTNFFTWTSQNGVKGKEIAPHFTGYQSFPNYPLEEDYSKNILQLYKPYIGSLNHDGFENYTLAFTHFMENDILCPRDIVRAVRSKREK